ncbi:hypothetical protein HMPREF0762_01525 [Slackia exigua ATCC 700122]|uniref:Uncharacterized protein n=1 Tax=Slackia exigua (strain ATCC 700122 / DSM 15923 / CIP 105133 / JCM 11022 / KCTC 5966 / S-7) TaxID=649764 RepID=D0WI53_SLAES|nr:hypothetical protein HMPREF0762_01525 [Slackia exigua ATCC 700122]
MQDAWHDAKLSGEENPRKSGIMFIRSMFSINTKGCRIVFDRQPPNTSRGDRYESGEIGSDARRRVVDEKSA